jgi:ketosteroid isomerase-like protein
MSQENVKIVREHFEAANRRDFDEVIASYAEDVQLVVPPSTILAGTYSGRDAVLRFFGDWFRAFGDGPQFELRELVDAGEAVVVHARSIARGARSGVELDTDFFYVYRVHGGKIAHVQFYDNWPLALEAAGLSD